MAKIVILHRLKGDTISEQLIMAGGTLLERLGDVSEETPGVGYYAIVGTCFIMPLKDELAEFHKQIKVPTSELEILDAKGEKIERPN